MQHPTSPPDTAPAPDHDGTMPYFPIFLDLRGHRVLLAGGTEAAASKARLLLRAGADVVVVADALCPDLARLARAAMVTWDRRAFAPDMVDGARIVIDGAGDPALTERVRAAAAARNVLVNVIDVPERCDFTVPAILDRSPVIVAISTGGAAPALARLIRQRLERAIPAGIGRVARAAALCRERVQRRLPAGHARQRFWDAVLDRAMADPPGEGAMVAAIEAALAQGVSGPDGGRGSVTLVGAGPGDPGLLTLHAARAIESADVILHDALVGPEILSMARREARLVPVGKRAGRPSTSQDLTNRMMVTWAQRGLRVVRLKGGDPFVFGRGGEEAAFLRAAGIPVTVVPGVTAALGIAAALGVPLTHRGVARSLRLVTASCRSAADTAALDWRAMADPATTLAIYMGRGRIAAVARALTAAGLSPATPAVAVENGTLPDQRHRFAPIGGLADAIHGFADDHPVLVLVGDAIGAAAGWAAQATVASPPRRRAVAL